MCWNQEVSLNTFLFSGFVLLLIIYNNAFTKYKIEELNYVWIYLFLASFIFMQLIEFFIWRNMNDAFYNRVFSTMAALLLMVQPVFSIMIIRSNIPLRNLLLVSYLVIAIPFSTFRFLTKKFQSEKTKTGHMRWKYFEGEPIILITWLFFFLFSLVYEKFWIGILLGVCLLFISYYNYRHEHSMGSMWCWMANSIMIYYALYLLFYLPFIEKNQIC